MVRAASELESKYSGDGCGRFWAYSDGMEHQRGQRG